MNMNISLNKIYTWPLPLKLVVMGIVTIMVFILLYFFDISGLKRTLYQSQQKEQELKDQLLAVINSQANQKNQLIRYRAVKQLLATWQSKLIRYDDLPTFMDQVLKIATANNVNFNLFSPDPAITVNNTPYTKIPIKIIALGTFEGLGTMISQIVNLPTITVINNISLTNDIKPEMLASTNLPQLKVNQLVALEMTLEVYYIEDKKDKK